MNDDLLTPKTYGTWQFYASDTGIMTGRRYTGPASDLSMNTPEGHTAVEGSYDHMSQRVDLSTGQVIAYQPPKPDDTEFLTYTWDKVTKRWASSLTDAGVGAAVRSDRDLRLSTCDWVVARAFETGTQVPDAWLQYRQALRDVSKQIGFPHVIVWPMVPV